MFRYAWAVRPYPHNIHRVPEFLANRMAAIGWPSIGDLAGCDREQINSKLKDSYQYEGGRLGQSTGVVDRFVNQVEIDDPIVVPDGDKVYLGVVTSGYSFKQHLATEKEGYPHWIGVDYRFDGQPILRSELPAALYDSLKGRQTVFSVPADAVWNVINNPSRFLPVDTGDQEVKAEYVSSLSAGGTPGINSPRFEEAVLKILSFYFPGLQRLATTNAPAGADTDLKTSLPGGIVVRVQVKCYRDDWGELRDDAVTQLRDSMEVGEHGIIVTSNRAGESAQKLAASDSLRPIGIIDGPEFSQLVFDNLDRLNDEDIWALGLRRALAVR
jgi:predicted Mrr-cat superfamily restriction endonuclease